MRLLLDTYIFVVAALEGFEALSAKTRKLLNDEETQPLLSTVSLTEVAIKTRIGKLAITGDQAQSAVNEMRLTLLPYTVKHALRMFDLPLLHGDPFDRMLIATALAEGLPILSPDRTFSEYPGLQLIKA